MKLKHSSFTIIHEPGEYKLAKNMGLTYEYLRGMLKVGSFYPGTIIRDGVGNYHKVIEQDMKGSEHWLQKLVRTNEIQH